jgi:hypothetical protein
MHKQAHLLNSIRDVRAGECEVLESSSETPIKCGISNTRTIMGGNFGFCINGCGDGVTV